MIEYGIVHSVQIVTLGSRLAADAAIGATSLNVDDVLDFNEDGGTLSLNGVQYVYTAADFGTDTIALASGLTGAALAADRVDVWPLTTEKQALVMVAGAEDALTVRVPYTMVDRMPEGIRDEDQQESIEYTEQGGELVILDVTGKEPVIEATYIDPALTDALAANDAAIEQLNTVTLPALQTELDGILPITATKITDGEITTPKLAAGAITTAKLAANAVTANEIAAGTITANEIAAGGVTAASLAANAIDGMIVTGAWVRTGVAPGPRVGLNDPGYPNQIALYSGNADELRPALIQPVLGGANYGTLTLESPALVPDRYAFINMSGYNDGLTAIESQANNWRINGTDTTIVGSNSLRLGDGFDYLTVVGTVISAEVATSIVAPSVEITGAVTVSGVPAVTTTGTQTLTNKTLGSGTVLPATVVQTTSAQALTNKDLTGAGNTFPATLLRTTTVQPYAYAHQNANTASWPDGAWTNVTTWTLDSNSGITHSAGTFTVPTAGRYRIFATLTFAANTTGARGVTLVINGTSRAAVLLPPATGFPSTTQVSMAYPLAVGGTIAIQGWQNSGATTTVLRGDAVGTYTNCQIEYVGP